MEYIDVNYENILNQLHNLIHLADSEIQIDSILIVGSNYDVSSKKKISKDSDIDFIILNQSKHFSMSEKFQGISYDISFVNHKDMGTIILGALSGSAFFGKFFSSMRKYTIIKDTGELGVKFADIINYLYNSFTASFIPNYEISSILLHNIAANKNDLRKNTLEEINFASLRLAEHVFNYMSYLAYPIHTSGSYRGKVIEKQFEYLKNRKNKTCILDKNDLLKTTQEISPVLEYDFFGVTDNEEIQKAISNEKIEDYYYGYDNLVKEERVVFLSENDILKNNFKLSYVNNIIPFLEKEQLSICTDFFISVSKKYQKVTLKDKLEFLLGILNGFRKENIHQVLVNTLKSLFIIKSITLLDENEKTMNIEVLDDWLEQTKEDFYFPKTPDIPLNLNEIFSIIINSATQRETEIKTCHIFFGIMKSLRIEIEDFYFQE